MIAMRAGTLILLAVNSTSRHDRRMGLWPTIRETGKVAWGAIGGVAVLIGLLGVYAAIPQLEVSPGLSADKIDPEETRFNVTNKSIYPLIDTAYTCQFKPKNAYQDTYVIKPPIGLGRLDPGLPKSIYCGGLLWHLKTARSGFLAINILYRLPFPWWDRDYGILYLMKRDLTSGEVLWLPQGGGMKMMEAYDYLHRHDPP